MNNQHQFFRLEALKTILLVAFIAAFVSGVAAVAVTSGIRAQKAATATAELNKKIAALQAQLSILNGARPPSDVTRADVVLAMRDFSVKTPATYALFRYDAATGERSDYGSVATTDLAVFALLRHIALYPGADGRLEAFDLLDGAPVNIALPGVESNRATAMSRGITDLVVDDDAVVYLHGNCASGDPCAIGLYDMHTQKARTVIADVRKAAGGRDGSSSQISLGAFDASSSMFRIVVVTDGKLRSFDADAVTGAMMQVDQATFASCGIGDLRPCNDVETGANEKFYRLAGNAPVQSRCGIAYVVETGASRTVTVATDDAKRTFNDTRVVGCLLR